MTLDADLAELEKMLDNMVDDCVERAEELSQGVALPSTAQTAKKIAEGFVKHRDTVRKARMKLRGRTAVFPGSMAPVLFTDMITPEPT